MVKHATGSGQRRKPAIGRWGEITAAELILVNLTVDAMENLMKCSFPDWVLIEREGAWNE